MSDTYHIDIETSSAVDLKKTGAFRYAEDDSTHILVLAIAKGDGPVTAWDVFSGGEEALNLYREAVSNRRNRIYAHNAQFEMALLNERSTPCLGVDPPHPHQWFCTMVMCGRACIPQSLDKAASFLGLDEDLQKDKAGKALITKFSVRREEPKGEDFHEFVRYCAQDVVAERAVHHALKNYDFEDKTLLTTGFHLDKEINLRGAPLDIEAVDRAVKVVETYEDRLRDEFRDLTGLNPTQTSKVLEWAKEKGYPGDNLQGQTITEVLDGGEIKDEALVRALEIRKALSFAATKKLKAMQATACKDARVRGALVFHGAKTGRWTSRLLQLQNLKRPTIKDTGDVIRYLQDENQWEHIEMLWDNPMEAVASSIRHFIQVPGQMIFDADYAAIEARVVCWLAGQQDALDEYHQGLDRYKRMASVIFGKPETSISKDERWVGKSAILGCGYGLGSSKFYSQNFINAAVMGITGVTITPELCDKAVENFRRTHHMIVKLWRRCEQAARKAILHPGQSFDGNPSGTVRYVYGVDKHCGIPFLRAYLPSGRFLSYPHPSISEDGDLVFTSKIPGSVRWGQVKTYGGALVENLCQAVAADIMMYGAYQARKEGFQIFMLVHDEALAEHNDWENVDTETFADCLRRKPGWADGLPIDVEGEKLWYYTKG